jgi:hypothetical protein
MHVQVACPKCRKALVVADAAADRASLCPACGAAFRLAPPADGLATWSTVGPAASRAGPAPPAAGPPGNVELPASFGPY